MNEENQQMYKWLRDGTIDLNNIKVTNKCIFLTYGTVESSWFEGNQYLWISRATLYHKVISPCYMYTDIKGVKSVMNETSYT